MATMEKIDRMPEEILRHNKPGTAPSPERLAFEALQPGENLCFTGEASELMRIRKRLECFISKEKKNGSEAEYKIAQRKNKLYAGRIK